MIPVKADRVKNYVDHTMHDLDELLTATGKSSPAELTVDDLYIPAGSALWRAVSEEPWLRDSIHTSASERPAPNASHSSRVP